MKKILLFILILITTNLYTYYFFARPRAQQHMVIQSSGPAKINKVALIGSVDSNNQTCDSYSNLKGLSANIIFCGDHIDFNTLGYLTLGSRVLENKYTVPNLFTQVKDIKVFPDDVPQFFVITAYDEHPTGTIETIGIYHMQNGIPKRVYSPENEEGDIYGRYLNYQFSNTESSFTETRSLGAIGCAGCAMEWKDYYIWNASTQAFLLDNISHLDYFNNLLTKYTDVNNTGCSQGIIDTAKDQNNLTLNEIYKKYPSINEYCGGAGSGIYKSKVIVLLKAIKTLQAISSAHNLGSVDIIKQQI